MNTKATRSDTSLQDALYALSLAQPMPNAAVLDDLVRRYPDYAVELTDIAIEFALDALCNDEDKEASSMTSDTSVVVLKAMSRFHNRLHAINVEQRISDAKANTESSNPFASLDRVEIRALGKRLNVNTVFILKLRDRLINADTMTEGFKRRVADELKTSLGIVVAHFSARPIVAMNAHYKAEQKPVAATKQTFEEAVRNSGLTSEQQASLLSL
jgi:hypothetical protein